MSAGLVKVHTGRNGEGCRGGDDECFLCMKGHGVGGEAAKVDEGRGGEVAGAELNFGAAACEDAMVCMDRVCIAITAHRERRR